MDPEKLDNRNIFSNFIKQQNQASQNLLAGKCVGTPVLDIDDLFVFFNENFEEFHHQDDFCVVLAFVHRCLKVWICRKDYLKDDIGILLANFLSEHKGSEKNTNIAIQIVYQVLSSINSFGCEEVNISEKVLRELAAILQSVESRALLSNCTACIQKFIEMFPDSYYNLKMLWSNLKKQINSNIQHGFTKEIEIDILVQLFDYFKMLQHNFHEDLILITTIQYLLKSDERKLRKFGFFLLRKLFQCFVENTNSVANMWMSAEHNKKIERSWKMYITVLENLEEEQSHLILPSMENLEDLVKGHHMPTSWLNILYVRLLNHKNNLVVRCSMEFFLKTFTLNDLCEDTLKHVLKASNCNSLFNYEGYFLKDEYFSSFLKGDVTILLKLFPEIENWKSLPLCIWLENLNLIEHLEMSPSFNDILKFTSCVRKCQNKLIRYKAIEICNLIFKDFIKNMSIREYILYIESLYNSADQYDGYNDLYDKKLCITHSKDNFVITPRFYEIVTKHSIRLFPFLKDIPVEEHGRLKYALFQVELDTEQFRAINDWYKLDLESLYPLSINKVIKHFQERLLGLSPYDKDELSECNKAAIAFYIQQRPSLTNEDEATLILILNTGFIDEWNQSNFAKRLLKDNKQKINLCIIDQLLEYKNSTITNLVVDYLVDVYDLETLRKYADVLLKQITENECSLWSTHEYFAIISKRLNILKEVTDEILKASPTQGDKRIEEVFTSKICNNGLLGTLYRLFNNQVQYHISESFAIDLIKYHISITKRKPRYFENSFEHRVKLRIAICIYHYFKLGNNLPVHTILEEIWNILLNENNQLNVTYIYEYILGKYELNGDKIASKLSEAIKLTSSQQVSIITVAYIYFASRSTSKSLKRTVMYNLMSLTMGANFQTRLFAQLSLYKLLKGEFSGMTDCQHTTLIENAAGDKIKDYLKDIRLNFNILPENIINAVLYITGTPFDEFLPGSFSKSEEIENCHERYVNKYKLIKNEKTVPLNDVNDQIQRKMNPIKDLTEPHSLIAYPTKKNTAEMYIVASLIDKLPNLGGLARTCEVLGIKNLVMDSKMHTEKDDFKNLSMTAENNINIHEVKPKDLKEFLILKKLEGFNIVGAEQTCNSKNFNNFQFPEKCVLLLGHEKDGIPAPLLALLDHAVEVPQFGQVRSLNVHVTGALFMWEYCKQHLIQK